ncbi:hypothetical protein DIPPA_17097 [Diplonema papillatum]|nr:hypothetical protein DIPPA_17097 [Diplonema papillatum]
MTLRAVRLLAPPKGVPLAADIMKPERSSYSFVYLHGFCSKRESEKSDALLEMARAKGAGFARLDFRAHGESTGMEIRDVTLSGLLDDVEALLDQAPELLDVYLVGSSIGALPAMRLSAKTRRVKGLLLLAPAAECIARWSELKRNEKGDHVIPSSFVGEIHIGQGMFDDAKDNAWTDENLAAGIPVPVLIAHGELDDAVPIEAGRRLFDSISFPIKKWLCLPEGDHRLNVQIRAILEDFDAFVLGAQNA